MTSWSDRGDKRREQQGQIICCSHPRASVSAWNETGPLGARENTPISGEWGNPLNTISYVFVAEVNPQPWRQLLVETRAYYLDAGATPAMRCLSMLLMRAVCRRRLDPRRDCAQCKRAKRGAHAPTLTACGPEGECGHPRADRPRLKKKGRNIHGAKRTPANLTKAKTGTLEHPLAIVKRHRL